MRHADRPGLFLLLLFLLRLGLRASVWSSPQELERARWRVEHLPWAQNVAGQVVRSADAWLSDPLPFPGMLTGYFHDYFCPRHAVQLIFDPRSPHRHVCPVDSQVFTGPKYDGAWAYMVHFRAQKALENLSLAYVLTGKVAYAQAALDWLRRVRDVYPSLPPHGEHAGLGKLMGQSLDEAVWAVSATGAYHILRTRGFVSDSEHRLFVKRLWRPMAELLENELRIRDRVHNITCWRDAGVAGLAFVMDDPRLLRRVLLDSGYSVQNQLLEGVASDGFWFEGSLGYHFYALHALLVSAKVAELEGVDLGPARKRLLAMLKAPVRLANQSGQLPALNDGWPNQRLQTREGLYELGSSLFPGAGLDTVAAWLVSHGANRGVEALLFGPEYLPRGQLSERSWLFRDTGLAVLRQGGTYALLKFGPHGGGHGHLDKLEFLLSLGGTWVSPDFGTAGYGIPSYREWYRRTASHNCVTVDGRAQRPARGELLAFGPAGGLQLVRARTDAAYPGVVLDRTLALSDSCLLVVDLVRSGKVHTFGWHFRADGALDVPFDTTTVSAGLRGDGASYYARVKKGRPAGKTWRLTWRTPAGLLHLTWYGQPGDTVYLGDEPGIPATHRYPFVLVRRRAKETTFLTLLSWQRRPRSQRVDVVASTEDQLTVRVDLGNEPVRLTLRRKHPDKGSAAWLTVERDRQVWDIPR